MNKNETVKIETLDEKEIRSLVKEAALSNYGIINVAQTNNKKGNKEDFIVIDIHKNTFSVEVHINVALGVKVTEIIRSCKKTIVTVLNHKYPKKCTFVDVYVEELLEK